MPNEPSELLKQTMFEIEDFIGMYDEAYFLTITLKPKLYKFSSITQLEMSNNDLFNILYKTTDNYYIVSEHTKAGNIHYHAVVHFNNAFQRINMMNTLKKNRTLGFIKLENENVKDKRSVSKYMTKDILTNYKIFRSSPHHSPRFIMNALEWRGIVE